MCKQPESYKFEWLGKSDAMQLARRPSNYCLCPCKEESVNFDETQNLYIEGDNLDALKLLQPMYSQKIKIIYIDPPYNTGNRFVYKDDYKEPLSKVVPEPGTRVRFHTAWLNMMYPRLMLAANLLRLDGVIFISIDDNELYNLKKICDEIFGEENFIGNIIVKSNPRGSQSKLGLAVQHEYLLAYAKNIESADIAGHELSEEMAKEYKHEDEAGKYRLLGLRQRGGFWRRIERPNLFYSIYLNPQDGALSLVESGNCLEIKPIQPTTGEDGTWRWSREKFRKEKKYLVARKIKRGGSEAWDIFQKDYIGNGKRTKVKSLWDDKTMNYQNGAAEIKNLLSARVFEYSKPVNLIKQALRAIGNGDSDIILDFFSGSAATAHAVMQQNKEDGGNRRFICVQIPELCGEKTAAYKAGYKNICEIGKERIRRASAKLLEAYSAHGGRQPPDAGFKVFKLNKTTQ